MRTTVRVEGLRELERALGELPRATRKNVVTRVLKARAEPMAAAMRARAPVEFGDLRDSIGVGTRLTRSARKSHKKQSPVEVFAGPGSHPQAVTQEFGTVNHGPQAYVRPAWDAGKDGALDGIASDLGAEIGKAAARAAKKALKAKG